MSTSYLSIPITSDEGRIVYLRYNIDFTMLEGYRFGMNTEWSMLPQSNNGIIHNQEPDHNVGLSGTELSTRYIHKPLD